MSLLKSVIKLNTVNPLLRQRRFVGSGWNHVVVGPPTGTRPAHWKKMTAYAIFTACMFSYPLYVTYMMHEWDLMDGNI